MHMSHAKYFDASKKEGAFIRANVVTYGYPSGIEGS